MSQWWVAVTDLVPYFWIAFTSLWSSSVAQLPFTTLDAIFANQRLRQSLFVLRGTCLAIACHFEGLSEPGSSKGESKMICILLHTHGAMDRVDLCSPRSTASLKSWSSSLVQDRRSRYIFSADRASLYWDKIEREATVTLSYIYKLRFRAKFVVIRWIKGIY